MKKITTINKRVVLIFAISVAIIFKGNAQQHFRLVVDSSQYYYNSNSIITKDKGILLYSNKNSSSLIKFDSLLNISWAKTNLPQDSYLSGDLIQDSSGNYFVPGIQYGATNEENFNIRKFDSLGNTINYIRGIPFHPETWAEYRALRFDSVNNRLLILYHYRRYDDITFQLIASDANLLVTDLNFNILWSKSINGDAFDDIFPVYDYNGNVSYLLRDIANTGGISKIDSSGNVLWRKKFTNTNDITSVIQKDSNYYFTAVNFFTGYFSSIFKTDLNGTVLNSLTANTSDGFYFSKIIMDKNSDLIVNAFNWIDGTTMLIKLDTGLNIISSYSDTTLYGAITSIDENNNFIIAASSGQTGFNAYRKTIIEKMSFNNSCGFSPVNYIMSPGNIYDSAVTILPFGSGRPFYFGFINPIPNLTITPYFECISTSISEPLVATFNIYPNPAFAQNLVTISSAANNLIYSVEIINTLGTTVAYKKASGNKVILQIPNINAGIYFARVTTDNGQLVKKLIIN